MKCFDGVESEVFPINRKVKFLSFLGFGLKVFDEAEDGAANSINQVFKCSNFRK